MENVLTTIIIFAIMFLIGFIPISVLYRHYINSRILDYFLMGTAILAAITQAIVVIIIDSYPDTLLLFQINDVLYPTFIAMFLLHGARLRWDRTPLSIKIVGAVWYGLLVVAVLFYEMVKLPNEGQVLFFHLKNTSSREEGQMLIINGVYAIGRGYEFYAHAFRLFAIIIILYSYIRTTEIAKEAKINNSRWILIISIISASVWPIGLMGEMLFLWDDAQIFINLHVFDLITIAGVTFIAIKYPETLLISKTQIIRVLRLHKELAEKYYTEKIPDEKSGTTQDYVSFLMAIMPELFKENIKEK